MKAKPLSYWLDAFFLLLETTQEMMYDRQKMSDMMKKPIDDIPMPDGQDMEMLKNRRQVWKRVKERFGEFGQDCYTTELGFHGLQTDENGAMRQTQPVLKVYRNDDKVPVVFVDAEEIYTVGRFFQFYRHFCFTKEPDALIVETLKKKGINKDNYHTHPQSPGGLITNPFKDSQ